MREIPLCEVLSETCVAGFAPAVIGPAQPGRLRFQTYTGSPPCPRAIGKSVTFGGAAAALAGKS